MSETFLFEQLYHLVQMNGGTWMKERVLFPPPSLVRILLLLPFLQISISFLWWNKGCRRRKRPSKRYYDWLHESAKLVHHSISIFCSTTDTPWHARDFSREGVRVNLLPFQRGSGEFARGGRLQRHRGRWRKRQPGPTGDALQEGNPHLNLFCLHTVY